MGTGGGHHSLTPHFRKNVSPYNGKGGFKGEKKKGTQGTVKYPPLREGGAVEGTESGTGWG